MTRPRRHPEQTAEEREVERQLIDQVVATHEQGGHHGHGAMEQAAEDGESAGDDEKRPPSPGT